jgi:hypothetical protein
LVVKHGSTGTETQTEINTTCMPQPSNCEEQPIDEQFVTCQSSIHNELQVVTRNLMTKKPRYATRSKKQCMNIE